MPDRALAMAIVAVLAAGCATPRAADPNVTVEGSPPGFQEIPGSVQVPGLDHAPSWQAGQWWTYHVEPFWGKPFDVTRVVVGTVGDRYLVGMPTDDFGHVGLVLHVPGFGEVGRSDLSFDVHDFRFQPVKFPLHDGDSWPVNFEGTLGTATAHLVNATVADIHHVTPGNDDFVLRYDANVGEFVSMSGTIYAAWTMVGHGFGFTGRVTVPVGADLVFYNGSCSIVREAHCASNGGEGAAGGDVQVGGDYDCTTFVVAVQDGIASPESTWPRPPHPLGAYSIKVVSPQGVEYKEAMDPSDSSWEHWTTFVAEHPTGTWHVESTSAGYGRSLLEGIAYQSYTFTLVQGSVQSAARGDPICPLFEPQT